MYIAVICVVQIRAPPNVDVVWQEGTSCWLFLQPKPRRLSQIVRATQTTPRATSTPAHLHCCDTISFQRCVDVTGLFSAHTCMMQHATTRLMRQQWKGVSNFPPSSIVFSSRFFRISQFNKGYQRKVASLKQQGDMALTVQVFQIARLIAHGSAGGQAAIAV